MSDSTSPGADIVTGARIVAVVFFCDHKYAILRVTVLVTIQNST